MKRRLNCSLPLPAGFRPQDILRFHRRDPQELAEHVSEATLEKGMLWNGVPACLTVAFVNDRAEANLAVDGAVPATGQAPFEAMVHRMLGLTQDVEGFEQRYRTHPQLGQLIARQAGLRVPVAATPFEALSWAITGQQISVQAAVSLRRKLIQATDRRHASGLLCYPDAAALAGLDEARLRAAGFSASKARTLLSLAEQVASGALPLDDWALDLPPVADMETQLLAVRGIGPWTVHYALLRGFGWLDGSLHGDVAVRRSLQALLGSPHKLGEREARDWLAPFSPWRALVGAHLWRYEAIEA